MTAASECKSLLWEIRETLITSGDEPKYRKLVKKIDALHLFDVRFNVYSSEHVPGFKKIEGVYHPWSNLMRFYNEQS